MNAGSGQSAPRKPCASQPWHPASSSAPAYRNTALGRCSRRESGRGGHRCSACRGARKTSGKQGASGQGLRGRTAAGQGEGKSPFAESLLGVSSCNLSQRVLLLLLGGGGLRGRPPSPGSVQGCARMHSPGAKEARLPFECTCKWTHQLSCAILYEWVHHPHPTPDYLPLHLPQQMPQCKPRPRWSALVGCAPRPKYPPPAAPGAAPSCCPQWHFPAASPPRPLTSWFLPPDNPIGRRSHAENAVLTPVLPAATFAASAVPSSLLAGKLIVSRSDWLSEGRCEGVNPAHPLCPGRRSSSRADRAQAGVAEPRAHLTSGDPDESF